jgi:hypothetical protein
METIFFEQCSVAPRNNNIFLTVYIHTYTRFSGPGKWNNKNQSQICLSKQMSETGSKHANRA